MYLLNLKLIATLFPCCITLNLPIVTFLRLQKYISVLWYVSSSKGSDYIHKCKQLYWITVCKMLPLELHNSCCDHINQKSQVIPSQEQSKHHYPVMLYCALFKDKYIH